MQTRDSKWKKKYEASRKYIPRWENDFSWVSEASIGGDAFCVVCQTSVGPKYSSLRKHETTKRHQTNVAAETLQSLQNSNQKGSQRQEGGIMATVENQNGRDPNDITMRDQIAPLSEGDEQGDNLVESSMPRIEKQEIMQFDTSQEFAEVFGAKEGEGFDSWNEFADYLEQFQRRTGTYYKPRSASSVDYANERRQKEPIPDRFVYSQVKMICTNFGNPPKQGPNVKKNYVGKGCGAYMSVSYTKGALRIANSYLIHNNHPPCTDSDKTPQRQIRAFAFSEELDKVIAKEVLKNNPFRCANAEKQWAATVERLKLDDRLVNITARLMKKRIRFLCDNFLAITRGRRPGPEDEMGTILYELDKSRKEAMDPSSRREKKKREPGRPRKRPLSEDEDALSDYEVPLSDNEDLEEEEYLPPSRASVAKKKDTRSSLSSSSAPISSEMTSLLKYLQKKDEDDRKLRREELSFQRKKDEEDRKLRKEELAFQKHQFEFEKIERKAILDLLKEQLLLNPNGKQVTNVVSKETNEVTEYTVLVDANNHVVESMPPLAS